MKVLIVSANRTEINMRTMPLGLACVTQAARHEGHVVRIIDLVQVGDVAGTLAAAIAGLDPDVIGVSIRNIDDQSMKNAKFLFHDDNWVIDLIRELSNVPIVLGGAGYSMYPEAILAASKADIGIEGEGEAVFNRLLKRMEDNEPVNDLPGVHVRGGGHITGRELIRTPDAFPLPDWSLMAAEPGDTAGIWVPVQTRRGCPMRCGYCSTGAIEGTVMRKRSVRSVVGWIAALSDRGVRQFYFVDNIFNMSPSYALGLCRELINASLKLKWRCTLYPYRLDEMLVSAMAQAGCIEASVGFESGDDRILKSMNKRFCREDIEETCLLLRRYGIQQMGFLLLGGPGETPESVRESLAFVDSLGLESMRITTGIRIYPGMALADQARDEGVIGADDDLLAPRFYIVPGLEDVVRQAVAAYAEKRPHWAADV